ncbi:MAG: glycosyltransferase family 9 protein [Planctomycetota bacterium]|jgi:heptosyltransferase-2
MAFELSLDCRHYLGDQPCQFHEKCRCEHYEPMGQRVLVIKTAAVGDVVRTASILTTLHRQYRPAHVTWISAVDGARILSCHPLIDRIVTFNAEGVTLVTQQQFDLVLSLDKEPGSAALCNQVASPDKRGMGLSQWGTVYPINEACRPYFELGLDNELKFHHNKKSYPQLIHEAVGLPYRREPYRLYCDAGTYEKARAMFAPWRAGGDPVVGVNTGSGRVFANKTFTPAKWVTVCQRLLERGFAVVLLGGTDEISHNRWIAERLGGRVHVAGNGHGELDFVAVVDQCAVIITGDTLALHVAVARGVPQVALFGPTCEQEIDLFDCGEKIISPHECVPCYHRSCDKQPNCMDVVDIDTVVDAAQRVLKTNLRSRPVPCNGCL